MADTFKRLGNLIKGMGNDWMNRIEADNPRAVVKAAMEGAESRYQEAKRSLGSLRQRDGAKRKEEETLRKEMAELEAHRDQVLVSDPALALQLEETRLGLEARIEAIKEEEVSRAKAIAELEASMEDLKSMAQGLGSEADSLVARQIVNQESIARDGLAGGMPTRAYERALQNVRDKTEAARDAAERSGPTPGEVTRMKAQAKLAALKAARLKSMGIEDEAAPEEADAPETEKGASPDEPTPLPKREL